MAKTAREEAQKNIAENRKAFHDYHILETFEAGVALLGTEVKSIREGSVNLRDSFARVESGEVWIYNVHINPYSHRGYADHEPTRKRKLLLHRPEIRKLIGKTVEKGMTLVPTRMYFKNGHVKVAISPGQGQEGARQARNDQAARDRSRNARRGQGAAALKRATVARFCRVLAPRPIVRRPTVPLLDLQAQYRPLRDEMLAAIDARLRQPALHPRARGRGARARARPRRSESPHAIGVSSGTDALLVALMALGIGPRRRSHHARRISFFATAGCVAGSARRRCSSTSTRHVQHRSRRPCARR